MTESIAIFCMSCGTSGETDMSRVASLQCRCGSSDFGLVGVDARPSVTAGAANPGVGTGWNQPMPSPTQGWSEYAGPTPQTFPRSAPVAMSSTCPVCHGSGYDTIDKGPCRECGGTGTITHPTNDSGVQSYDPGRPSPAGGAGWHGASIGLSTEALARVAGRPSAAPELSPEQHIRATTPDYGRKAPTGPFKPGDEETFYPKADTRSPAVKDWSPAAPASGPYQMDQASCPHCGHAPTELRQDKNENSWWTCPSCGPLANIDAQTHIDPYQPRETGYQGPYPGFKTGGFLTRNRKTGRLHKVLSMIHQANDLNEIEAVTLARHTLISYPEGR